MCFGTHRQDSKRAPLRPTTVQEKTEVTVEKDCNGTLCIKVSERTNEITIVKRMQKTSNVSHSENVLLQNLNQDGGGYYPKGQFRTLQRSRRHQPILKPHIGQQHGLDDAYNGVVQCLIASSGQWAFSTFSLDVATGGHSLSVLLVHLFHQYGLIAKFHLDVLKVYNCFNLIESNYHVDNPYHNSVHAADVTQAMHCFLQEEVIAQQVTPSEIMASLLGAVCHDLDHPGVNQPFLIATSNHLAALYKNFSVLENHHWRSAVSCLRESELLDHLSEVRDDVECQMRSLILATDIARQQEFLSRFKKYMEEGSPDLSKKEFRHFILQLGLKCADLCNPCRPWAISQQWSFQVCQEFYRQGDIERELGLPVTPMCDRTRTSVARIQTDFFLYVVSPLFEIWDQFMNTTLSNQLVKNLRYNQAEWEKVLEKELCDKEETSTFIGVAAMAMEEFAPLASDEEDTFDECGSLLSESFFLGEAFGTFQRRRYSMPEKIVSILPTDASRQTSAPRALAYRRKSSNGSSSFRVPSPNLCMLSEGTTASRLLQPRTSIATLSAGIGSMYLDRFQMLAEGKREPSFQHRSISFLEKPDEKLEDIKTGEDIDVGSQMTEYSRRRSRTPEESVPQQMCAQQISGSPGEGVASFTKEEVSDEKRDDLGDSRGEDEATVLDCSNGCCTRTPSPKSPTVKNAQQTEYFRQSDSGLISRNQGSNQIIACNSARSICREKDWTSHQSGGNSSRDSVDTSDQYMNLLGCEQNGATVRLGAARLAEQRDESYVFKEGGHRNTEFTTRMKQTSWSTHVSRSLSEERPEPPSKDFDFPAPSLRVSTNSLSSTNSRLTSRRGSAPVVVTRSALSEFQDLSEFDDELKERPLASPFGRRWSIPAEPVTGFLPDSFSSNLKNKEDDNCRYSRQYLRKELIRRHSFGLLDNLLVVPSSESENDGSSTGPTSTGTTCSTRRNSSVQPGTIHRSFTSRGAFFDQEGSFNSETQDVFLPSILPSIKQLARRRGSLPVDVPLPLMSRLKPALSPTHPRPAFEMEPLQKLEREAHSENLVCRRKSVGEILQVLLCPTGNCLTFQGLNAGSSRGQQTVKQGMVISSRHPEFQGLPRRRSGGLELFSGFWHSKTQEKSPEQCTYKQRVKLLRQSCSLDSSGYPEWLFQPSVTDTLNHAVCNSGTFSVTTDGFLNTARYQQRRGSVPINFRLLSLSSGDTPSED